jgi:hypothetical protein
VLPMVRNFVAAPECVGKNTIPIKKDNITAVIQAFFLFMVRSPFPLIFVLPPLPRFLVYEKEAISEGLSVEFQAS